MLTGYNLFSAILRLVLSCLCGAIVGLERTKRLKEAGIRTHCIICSASALMMMISEFGFSEIIGASGVKEADAARIAAQVISGISFLGAGVIFRNGSSVKGLTTAAGIWATAGIGLALGCGMYIPGMVLTALVVIIQVTFHHFSIGNDAFADTDVEITAVGTESFRKKLLNDMEERSIQLLSIRMNNMGDFIEYSISFRPRRDYSPAAIERLMEEYPEIKSVHVIC